jgi:hypothetical protein
MTPRHRGGDHGGGRDRTGALSGGAGGRRHRRDEPRLARLVQHLRRPLRVGVRGRTGAGCATVSRALRRRGATVLAGPTPSTSRSTCWPRQSNPRTPPRFTGPDQPGWWSSTRPTCAASAEQDRWRGLRRTVGPCRRSAASRSCPWRRCWPLPTSTTTWSARWGCSPTSRPTSAPPTASPRVCTRCPWPSASDCWPNSTCSASPTPCWRCAAARTGQRSTRPCID